MLVVTVSVLRERILYGMIFGCLVALVGKIIPTSSFSGFMACFCYNRPDRGDFMQTVLDSKSFCLLIRSERKAQRLTQAQLAGLTGVGVRFVRELEAGKESCQIGLALQVAASLGLVVCVGSRREAE